MSADSIPRTRTGLTFALLAVGTASFALLQSLVTPVLPTIQQELGTSRSAVSWILIAWLLAAAVTTPIVGRMGDMLGKDRALTFALGAIVLGSVIAALAPSLAIVVLGRVVQGLGGAIFPLAFGILRDEFPRDRLPAAIGSVSAVIAVGGGLGMVLAGPILNLFNWRWLFWLPAIVVGAVAVLSRIIVPASPVRTGGSINWLGAALLASWLIALLVPVSEGTAWGWSSPQVIGSLVSAVVLFATWAVVESRSANPVIDMQMMRMRVVWTTNLAALLLGAVMFGTYAYLPQLMQVPRESGYGLGAGTGLAGLLVLPMLAAMAVVGMISGRVVHVIGFKAQLTAGASLLALACVSIAALHATGAELALAGAVFGIGLGLAYATMISLIVQSVPTSQTGVATGMNTNIRTIGGAVGAALMTAVVTAHTNSDGYPAQRGFVFGFLTLAALAVGCVGVSLLVPTRQQPDDQAPAVLTLEPEAAGLEAATASTAR